MQDADSLDKVSGEKKEGEFYVWTKAEVDEVLGGADSKLSQSFASFYHILADGNTTLSQMRWAIHSYDVNVQLDEKSMFLTPKKQE